MRQTYAVFLELLPCDATCKLRVLQMLLHRIGDKWNCHFLTKWKVPLSGLGIKFLVKACTPRSKRHPRQEIYKQPSWPGLLEKLFATSSVCEPDGGHHAFEPKYLLTTSRNTLSTSRTLCRVFQRPTYSTTTRRIS